MPSGSIGDNSEYSSMNLKDELFKAFASCPRPAADGIIRPMSRNHPESVGLQKLLADVTPEELTEADIRRDVEGNLSMLTPEAFRYFLPAFMHAAIAWYSSVSVFASELVGALTVPSREEKMASLDQAAEVLAMTNMSQEMIDTFRKTQREFIESGADERRFRERTEVITPAEGAAVLAFLDAFQAAHGEDFPFGEVEAAIDRYWGRYRGSGDK